MTRSLVLANTSNHRGEDYDVSFTGKDGERRSYDLKPGDYLYLGIYLDGKIDEENGEGLPRDLVITPVESEAPTPYYRDDGKQTTPSLNVGWSGGTVHSCVRSRPVPRRRRLPPELRPTARPHGGARKGPFFVPSTPGRGGSPERALSAP